MDQAVFEEDAQFAERYGVGVDPGNARNEAVSEFRVVAGVVFQCRIVQSGQEALFAGEVVGDERGKIKEQVLDVGVGQSGVGVDLQAGSGGEKDQLPVLGVERGVANA